MIATSHNQTSVSSDPSRFEIIEDLWFGDFSDEAAEQAAANSLAAVAAEVYGLRPFPHAAQRLLTLIQEPDYSIHEVVSTIEADPSLAARVLRTINSAAYFLPTRVASVPRAVRLLGPRAVGEIAMGMSVLKMFDDRGGASAEIRHHLRRVASLARLLAMYCGLPADDVYTSGLLHDMGKLLLLQVRDRDYKMALGGARARDEMHLHEREVYGFDHAVLGGHVLRGWGLPDPLPAVVAWHHRPARAYEEGGATSRLVSLVRLADRLAYELDAQRIADDELVEDLSQDEAVSYLRLDGAALVEIWDDLQLVCLEGGQGAGRRPRRSLSAPKRAGATDPSANEAEAGDTEAGDTEGGAEQPDERCAVCHAESAARCVRCDRAMCADHLPPHGKRCRACEADYRQLAAVSGIEQRSLAPLRLWIAVLLALVTIGAITAYLPFGRWFAGMFVLAMLPALSAPLVYRLRRHRLRRQFMRERVVEV